MRYMSQYMYMSHIDDAGHTLTCFLPLSIFSLSLVSVHSVFVGCTQQVYVVDRISLNMFSLSLSLSLSLEYVYLFFCSYF